MQKASSPDGSNASGDSSVLAVLLGASNLARAYGCLTHCLRRGVHPADIEFLSARGPGRGYCAPGGLFHVIYPPIGNCGIRSAIRERAGGKSRAVALVTDIGNDIMYGVPAGELMRCLEELFDELRGLGARVLVTSIHVDLERDVGEAYFNILRRVFYPHSGVEFSRAAAAVKEVNAFLEESAREKIVLLRGMGEFCGADKIHYSLFKSHRGWSVIAEELFRLLGTLRKPDIHPVSMAGSLLSYLSDLVFCDMVPLVKKKDGTF